MFSDLYTMKNENKCKGKSWKLIKCLYSKVTIHLLYAEELEVSLSLAFHIWQTLSM